MLRRSLPLVALIAASAAAQPQPDTTAPARYFPLGAGDVWEYEGSGFFEGFQRREVAGDTMIGGETFARYRITHFSGAGAPADSSSDVFLRVDPTADAIRTPDSDPEVLIALHLTTCDLGAPFLAELFDCPGSAVVLTSGGPETVYIGDDSLATSLKFFDDNSRELVGTYAADIGFLGSTMRTGQLALVHARVGGVTYGTPIPVASAPAPAPGAGLRLAARPNPVGGNAALEVTMPETATLIVQVFDALGRRVWHDSSIRPAGTTRIAIDAGAWSPGTYLVRALAGGAVATTLLVRR